MVNKNQKNIFKLALIPAAVALFAGCADRDVEKFTVTVADGYGIGCTINAGAGIGVSELGNGKYLFSSAPTQVYSASGCTDSVTKKTLPTLKSPPPAEGKNQGTVTPVTTLGASIYQKAVSAGKDPSVALTEASSKAAKAFGLPSNTDPQDYDFIAKKDSNVSREATKFVAALGAMEDKLSNGAGFNDAALDTILDKYATALENIGDDAAINLYNSDFLNANFADFDVTDITNINNAYDSLDLNANDDFTDVFARLATLTSNLFDAFDAVGDFDSAASGFGTGFDLDTIDILDGLDLSTIDTGATGGTGGTGSTGVN